MLPNGKCGKQYIDERSRLLYSWVEDSPLKEVAFKAIMVMPSLLLQKPNKTSKTKDHMDALERLKLWHSGDLLQLLEECQTIQKFLPNINQPKNIGELSKRFAELMHKGNVNGAIKLLSNSMQNGILPLNDETLKLLRQKHPLPTEPVEDILLPDQPGAVHSIKFENITGDYTAGSYQN